MLCPYYNAGCCLFKLFAKGGGSAKKQVYTCLCAAGEPDVSGRVAPIREDPDFGEVFVFAVVAVIRGQHFPQLLRELIGLARGIGVMFAFLVVANAEARAAAIAKLESFDRIGRIFRDFFVENRHWTVQIIRHVILRWG